MRPRPTRWIQALARSADVTRASTNITAPIIVVTLGVGAGSGGDVRDDVVGDARVRPDDDAGDVDHAGRQHEADGIGRGIGGVEIGKRHVGIGVTHGSVLTAVPA